MRDFVCKEIQAPRLRDIKSAYNVIKDASLFKWNAPLGWTIIYFYFNWLKMKKGPSDLQEQDKSSAVE